MLRIHVLLGQLPVPVLAVLLAIFIVYAYVFALSYIQFHANEMLTMMSGTCLADGCLSYEQFAVQLSDDLPTVFALDANPTTWSCTFDDRGNPWFVVDLGMRYEIGYIDITLPNVGGEIRQFA